MKKYFLCTLFVALCFLCKVNVLAVETECTQAEKVRLRELVSATQITYEFYEDEEMDDDEGEPFKGYRVSISNFKPDFYVYDDVSASSFRYEGNSTITDYYFIGGYSYTFPFYASVGTPCEGYLIMTKNLHLVPYNQYSEDPLCKGHKTYELCKKFTPINIASQQDFENRMYKYIKGLEDKKNEELPIEEPVPEETIWQSILDFLANNYMIILITIVILGTTGIVVIEVRKRRSIL